MRTLLRFFLPTILTYCAVNAVLFPALILALQWAFGAGLGAGELAWALAPTWLVLGWVIGDAQLRRSLAANKEWMLALPIPRWRIFAFVPVVSVVFAFFYTLSLIPFLGVAVFMIMGGGANQALQALPLDQVAAEIWALLSGVPLTLIALIYGGSLAFLMGSVSVYRRRPNVPLLQAALARGATTTARWQAAGGILAVFVFMALPLAGKIALGAFVLTIAFATQLANTLLADRRTQRFFQAGGAAVATLFMGALLAIAAVKSGSPALASRLDGYRMLGSFAPLDSQQLTRDVLENKLEWYELSDLYRTLPALATNGRLDGKSLDLVKAIRSKPEPRMAAKMVALITPADVKPEAVRALIQHTAAARDGTGCAVSVAALAPVPAAHALVADLLAGETAEVCVGLGLARYRPQAFLASVIMKRFREFNDAAKWQALLTLSILRGRDTTLNEVAEQTYGSSPARELASAEGEPCAAFSLPSKLDAANAAMTNRCLRGRIPAAAFQERLDLEVDLQGWLSPPFNYSERQILRRRFPK